MTKSDETKSTAGRPRGISATGLAMREHILTIAARLFAQKTYGGVGLTELLHEADCPKGSCYHYFASKEAPALELARAKGERDGAAMNQLLHGIRPTRC